MRDVMLIIHILSVAIFIGAAISGFILKRVSNKFDNELFVKFNSGLLSLNYLGKTGLTLLIITGGYLMTPYWSVLGTMPLLITKLTLVVLLLVLLVVISIRAKKAKKEQESQAFNKLVPLQNLNLAISIIVLILAVLVFH
jgi:heme/copper-type cytochrome/quinol oxidase subunit 2